MFYKLKSEDTLEKELGSNWIKTFKWAANMKGLNNWVLIPDSYWWNPKESELFILNNVPSKGCVWIHKKTMEISSNKVEKPEAYYFYSKELFTKFSDWREEFLE